MADDPKGGLFNPTVTVVMDPATMAEIEAVRQTVASFVDPATKIAEAAQSLAVSVATVVASLVQFLPK